VDEGRPTVSQHTTCEWLGSDAAPVVVEARPPAQGNEKRVSTGNQIQQLPAEPPDENSLIVFSGDEKQVREGFAIALRATGMVASFLPTNIPLSTIRPNREDT
jgi:hypothetical protein